MNHQPWGVCVWAWNPADSTPEGQFPESPLQGTNVVLRCCVEALRAPFFLLICCREEQVVWEKHSVTWWQPLPILLVFSISSLFPPCSSFFLFFQKCYSGLRLGRKTGKPGGLRRERNLSGKSVAGLEAMILPQRTALVPNVAYRKNILPTLKYRWTRPRPE